MTRISLRTFAAMVGGAALALGCGSDGELLGARGVAGAAAGDAGHGAGGGSGGTAGASGGHAGQTTGSGGDGASAQGGNGATSGTAGTGGTAHAGTGGSGAGGTDTGGSNAHGGQNTAGSGATHLGGATGVAGGDSSGGHAGAIEMGGAVGHAGASGSSGASGSAGSGTQCGGIAGTTCSGTEWCHYPDGMCGANDEVGTCSTIAGIACVEVVACGCDHRAYRDPCSAYRAGVDTTGDQSCVTGNGVAGDACILDTDCDSAFKCCQSPIGVMSCTTPSNAMCPLTP